MTKFSHTRGASLMLVFLLALSMFSGAFDLSGSGIGMRPIAVMAAEGDDDTAGGGKGVDALWGTISDDGTSIGNELDNATTDLGTAVKTSKKVAQAITSVLTVISFVSFLFWVSKLAMSAGNPQTRRVAISGIMFSGIALALFGGAWVVVSFFWNLLSGV